MIHYREILRLRSLGYSQRQIASSVHSSRDTISQVFHLSDIHELSWPLDDDLTDSTIQTLFYPERSGDSGRKAPDYAAVHRELAKPGVTLTLLWAEYCEACYAEKSVPYQYTQFCDNYRKWAKVTRATMRIRRKPGDIMEVDWAGNTMNIYDDVTGESTPAYLFIAVLPCSCYAYVEAFPNMKSECWITGHVHAYSFFGGVTRILIPDNLKAGVTKNTRYETILNRNYSEMAEYYATAVIPARVEHPRDKPNAEGTVKHASTWIVAALRNRKYFSIHELNEAVSVKLQEFNAKPFQQREGSRLQAFMDEERSFLKPLPASPYEQAVWSTATIQSDYLITDGINKYSVPFDLIGEIVDIRVTSRTIEAFYQGMRVASHPRLPRKQRYPVIITEHMPDNHKKYLSYNEDDFLNWAHSIGNATVDVVKHFLSEGKVSEQGYKACASLTKLAGRYGHDHLEDACIRALAYASSPSIRNINTILKNGQDRNKDKKPVAISNGNKYGFTRGSSYYGGGSRD